MQDIAGLRIVEEMGIGAQNEMVERIISLFAGARVVDRRRQLLHARLHARQKSLEASVSELSDTVRDKLKKLLEETDSTT